MEDVGTHKDVLREAEFWDTPVKEHPHKGIDDLVEGARIVDKWWDDMRRTGGVSHPLIEDPVVVAVDEILAEAGLNHVEMSAWWVECREDLEGRAPRELLETLEQETLPGLASETVKNLQ